VSNDDKFHLILRISSQHQTPNSIVHQIQTDQLTSVHQSVSLSESHLFCLFTRSSCQYNNGTNTHKIANINATLIQSYTVNIYNNYCIQGVPGKHYSVAESSLDKQSATTFFDPICIEKSHYTTCQKQVFQLCYRYDRQHTRLSIDTQSNFYDLELHYTIPQRTTLYCFLKSLCQSQ